MHPGENKRSLLIRARRRSKMHFHSLLVQFLHESERADFSPVEKACLV
jgi:hypothetical protein